MGFSCYGWGRVPKCEQGTSSLEFRCRSNSDIDLYIEKYDAEKKLEYVPELDCETDIITNLQPGSRLYREIEQKGLLLFER